MIYSEKQQALLSMFPLDKSSIAPSVLFKNLNFDTEKNGYLLALSQLGHESNWINFPSEIIPRLKGIRRQIQVRNILSLHDSIKLFKALNEADIDYFVYDNLGFTLLSLDKVPLITSKIHICIKPKSKKKILSIALHLGFSCMHCYDSNLLIKINNTMVIASCSFQNSFENLQVTQVSNVPIFIASVNQLLTIHKLQALKKYVITCNTDVLFYHECLLKANNLKTNFSCNLPLFKQNEGKTIFKRLQQNFNGYIFLKSQHLIKTNMSFLSYLTNKGKMYE